MRSLVDYGCATKAMAVVVDSIPARQEQVATMEDVKGRGHLADVKLIELRSKEVDLLIGTDCASAFTPLEVRQSPKGGPTAWRTAFGWCLLGQGGADFEPEVWMAAFDIKKVDENVHDAINVDVDVDVDEDDVPVGAPSEEALKKLVNGISSVRKEGGFDVEEIASKSRKSLESVP